MTDKGGRSTRKKLGRPARSKLTHPSERPRSLTPPETCVTNTEMYLTRGCGEGSPLCGTFSDNQGPFTEPEVKNESIGTQHGWREALKEKSVRSWQRTGLTWVALGYQTLHFNV